MADIITPFGTKTETLPVARQPDGVMKYRCPICDAENYACK